MPVSSCTNKTAAVTTLVHPLFIHVGTQAGCSISSWHHRLLSSNDERCLLKRINYIDAMGICSGNRSRVKQQKLVLTAFMAQQLTDNALQFLPHQVHFCETTQASKLLGYQKPVPALWHALYKPESSALVKPRSQTYCWCFELAILALTNLWSHVRPFKNHLIKNETLALCYAYAIL